MKITKTQLRKIIKEELQQLKEKKLKELIRETIKEIEFKDQQSFRSYQSRHKMRSSTKVTIGGKETTVSKASKAGGGLLKQTSTDKLQSISRSDVKNKYNFLKSLGIEGKEDVLKANKKLDKQREKARLGIGSEYAQQMAEMGIKPGDTFDGDPIPDEETLNKDYDGLEGWLDYQVEMYNGGAPYAQGPEYQKLAKKHEKIKNSDEYKKTEEKFARVNALKNTADEVVSFYYSYQA